MNHVNFWGHSDADMLEIGNGGLSPAEERTHFAFWAAMKSPLLIGCDLAKIPPSSLAILKNKYLLAFNQDDSIGEPATPYKWGSNPDWTFDAVHPAEFWSGRFKQGTMVLVLNVGKAQASKRVVWAEVPQLKNGARYRVTDAWTGTSYGCFDGGFDAVIQAHDTAALVVTSDCGARTRRHA
jgi:alpha-galactosidase